MPSIADALPPAVSEATLDTVGTIAAREVSVVLDQRSLVVDNVAIPLDDRLDVTLAWSHPDRADLVLELASVVSPTERHRVHLAARLERGSPWAGVALVALAVPPTACHVGFAALETVLARVRAAVESSSSDLDRIWSRADLPATLPIDLDPAFTPPTADGLRGWADVWRDDRGVVLRRIPPFSEPFVRHSIYWWLGLTFATFVVVASLGLLLGWRKQTLFLATSWIGILVFFITPIVRLGLWWRIRPPKRWLDADRFDDHPRPRHLFVDGDTLCFVYRDRLVRAANLAVWFDVLSAAWHLEPPRAFEEVENMQDWMWSVPSEFVRGRLAVAADVLWLGKVGLSPRGVLLPEEESWTRRPDALRRVAEHSGLPQAELDRLYQTLWTETPDNGARASREKAQPSSSP